jgi:hypothetical protein
MWGHVGTNIGHQYVIICQPENRGTGNRWTIFDG